MSVCMEIYGAIQPIQRSRHRGGHRGPAAAPFGGGTKRTPANRGPAVVAAAGPKRTLRSRYVYRSFRHIAFTHPRPTSARSQKLEAAMLADIIYFLGGLAAFGLIALSVSAAGRL